MIGSIARRVRRKFAFFAAAPDRSILQPGINILPRERIEGSNRQKKLRRGRNLQCKPLRMQNHRGKGIRFAVSQIVEGAVFRRSFSVTPPSPPIALRRLRASNRPKGNLPCRRGVRGPKAIVGTKGRGRRLVHFGRRGDASAELTRPSRSASSSSTAADSRSGVS